MKIHYRAANGGKIWNVIETIIKEEDLSSKKFADIAAGIPLAGGSTHTKRILARNRFYQQLRTVLVKGDGSRLDTLMAMVTIRELHLPTEVTLYGITVYGHLISRKRTLGKGTNHGNSRNGMSKVRKRALRKRRNICYISKKQ